MKWVILQRTYTDYQTRRVKSGIWYQTARKLRQRTPPKIETKLQMGNSQSASLSSKEIKDGKSKSELDLSDRNIRDLPKNITVIQSLTRLKLNNNHIVDIPDYFRKLYYMFLWMRNMMTCRNIRILWKAGASRLFSKQYRFIPREPSRITSVHQCR